ALVLYPKKWKRVYFILLLTLLVDLDHLWAEPIYDPDRCSINYHFLHSYFSIIIYSLYMFYKYISILDICYFLLKLTVSHVFICILLRVVDIEHLLADPNYDTDHFRLKYHFMHSYNAIIIYSIAMLYKPTRIIDLCLLLHMITDSIDCIWMYYS